MDRSPDQRPDGRRPTRRDFSAPPVERPEAVDEFIYEVYQAALEKERTQQPSAYGQTPPGAAYRQQSVYGRQARPGEPTQSGGPQQRGGQGPRPDTARRQSARPPESEPAPRRGGSHLAGKPPKQTAAKPAAAPQKPNGAAKPKKRKSRGHRLRVAAMTALLLAGLYCIAVFSNIPFIKKWREIYIETAMGTMTHQWLATAFIPGFVIDEVMEARSGLEDDQSGYETNWSVGSLSGADHSLKWSKLKKSFFKQYPEIDEDSFNEYLDEHGDECLVGGYLLIDKAGLDDGGTSIRTIHGDEVLAIDTVNGITIVKVTGSEYVGRLAIIKNPAQVGLALSKNFGKSGSIIADIAESSGAVLATNASGFYDPGGHGNGGTPHGLVIKDGELLWDWVGQGGDKAIGFDKKNQLNIENYQKDNDFRDAVEFKPVLVLDGEKVISGSAGWGMQPRSAIGQTADGQVLLLIVDGRQPGYSIGCTMGDLADIMERYGAQQACNLDGGSSSIMYYNGRKITKPSAADKTNGRLLPNAFVVSPR